MAKDRTSSRRWSRSSKEHPETDAEEITRIVGESCSAVQMFDLTDDPDVVSLVGILARPELRLGLGLERKRLA